MKTTHTQSRIHGTWPKKLHLPLTALAALVSGGLATAQLYWDSNGSTAGAGAAPTGTWGTSNFWNTDSAGGNGTFSTATTSSDSLVFVAGPGASSGNGAYTVTLNGTQSALGLTFNSTGAPLLTSGTINLGSGGITGSSGHGAVTIASDIALQASSTFANNAAAGATNQINVTGLISGGFAINKTGTGRLRLENAGNSFSGGVTLTSGEPVAAKVLTPRKRPRGGEARDVDSKRMTPKKVKDVDESKNERRAVAADEAEVCGEKQRGTRGYVERSV